MGWPMREANVELRQSDFRVYGLPVPQGGMRMMPSGGMVSTGGAGLKPWRQAVSDEAQVCRVNGRRHTGPIAVHVDYRFPMPQSRKAAQRRADSIPMTVRPDLDKLLRAVLDSLKTGALILDDSQVAEIHATKSEWSDSWSGADISVRDLWTP
jgi:Holliday junction resolvase RusA-like endonuclease